MCAGKMATVAASAPSSRALRSATGASMASSRLPVRGAKRPAATQEAAAPMPKQKRARPGGGSGGGGGCRAPLKALSVTTVGKPAAPRKTRPAAAAPGAGAPPPGAAVAAPRSKRAPWDLRGQVSDLRLALEGSKERSQRLEKESCDLRQRLGESQSREEQLREQLGSLSTELAELRQAQALERQQAQQLAQEQAQQMQLCQAQLCQAQASLQAQTSLAAELQAQTQAQQQLLEQLQDRIHQLEMERRMLHNTVQELKGNIRVFCRVRPLLAKEQEKQQRLQHLHFPPGTDTALVLCKPDESQVGRERKEELHYSFSFDRVFPPEASQQQVFSEIALLVQSALDGYHVCIFAYGQTGSGKTYTMEGPDPLDPSSRGLIPRAVCQVFQGAQQLADKGWQYEFSASFLEIYNETLRDLLSPGRQEQGPWRQEQGPGRQERGWEPLEIRRVSSDSDRLHVPGLRRVPVRTEREVLALLQTASANRAVAKTALNDRSSRSHCIFQLHIHGSHPGRDLSCSSVLSLVDLAGSERLDKSLSKGERLRETQAINTSLSTLGLVIMALSNKEAHIPYRNSKLTYLLQNSLGGSAKMLMLVNISPLEENFGESLNSLRFASKVNDCVVGTARTNRK